MPQTEILANVTVVTDDDTGMWSIGEVEGQFFNDRLKEHIESHGVNSILIQLNQMIYSAIDMNRDIQNELQLIKEATECLDEIESILSSVDKKLSK